MLPVTLFRYLLFFFKFVRSKLLKIIINLHSNVNSNDNLLARNYTPDAWKTTHHKSKAGTQRITGSIDTLNYDIQELTPCELDAEINLRKSQLIHDIYVFLTLCNFKKPKNIC
jgi:hypothetical protein